MKLTKYSTRNLITDLLSFLIPQNIETVNSPINGKIRIDYYRRQYRSSVGGYWQSGEYAKRTIKTALRDLPINLGKVKKVLILGLGCGSMVEVLNSLHPNSQITGVDIDQIMIDLGKKYFNLGKTKNLKIVTSDAFVYLQKMNRNELFYLVVSDLFIGCDTNPSLESKQFIKLIFDHLSPGGIYISNHSYLEKYQPQADLFVSLLKKQFYRVETILKKPNLIIRSFRD